VLAGGERERESLRASKVSISYISSLSLSLASAAAPGLHSIYAAPRHDEFITDAMLRLEPALYVRTCLESFP
jgi:hypothetical protein